jgi:inner membrane protein YidH
MADEQSAAAVIRKSPLEDPSVELGARRTGMSFQRTRMSADRTLMSVIRTSISLISFGFTIFQFFQKLKDSNVFRDPQRAPRAFGQSLVWLGLVMLIVGIIYHLQFMRGLRREREAMRAEGLIHAESQFPVSMTLLVALALLVIGIFALLSITVHSGPFE